jgi:hypothetical protein
VLIFIKGCSETKVREVLANAIKIIHRKEKDING